jgi:hypothetical protein
VYYRYTEGEKFVRLSADMKWIGYSSKGRTREQLVNLVCNEKSSFKNIAEEVARPNSNKVEMCVKGGKVTGRSCFVLIKCSRQKSRIIGTCSTNKLVDLLKDFDFLKEQMKKSNLNFTLSDPKVFLDNDEYRSAVGKQRLSVKSILPEMLGTIGFVSGATSYVIFGGFNPITVIAFSMGLLCWLGSIIIGSENSTKYVFVEQE